MKKIIAITFLIMLIGILFGAWHYYDKKQGAGNDNAWVENQTQVLSFYYDANTPNITAKQIEDGQAHILLVLNKTEKVIIPHVLQNFGQLARLDSDNNAMLELKDPYETLYIGKYHEKFNTLVVHSLHKSGVMSINLHYQDSKPVSAQIYFRDRTKRNIFQVKVAMPLKNIKVRLINKKLDYAF